MSRTFPKEIPPNYLAASNITRTDVDRQTTFDRATNTPKEHVNITRTADDSKTTAASRNKTNTTRTAIVFNAPDNPRNDFLAYRNLI